MNHLHSLETVGGVPLPVPAAVPGRRRLRWWKGNDHVHGSTRVSRGHAGLFFLLSSAARSSLYFVLNVLER